MRNLSSSRSPVGRRYRAIFLAAALFAACRHQTPEQDLADKADPAASWIATLQMTGEKWIANSVPTAFVKTTWQAAREDLQQAARDAADSKARPEVRDPLRRLIADTRTAGFSLLQATEANDRPGAARQASRLRDIQKQFEAWKKSVGAPLAGRRRRSSPSASSPASAGSSTSATSPPAPRPAPASASSSSGRWPSAPSS